MPPRCSNCLADLSSATGSTCAGCGLDPFPSPLARIGAALDPHLVWILAITSPLLVLLRLSFRDHPLNRYLLAVAVAGYGFLIALWAGERLWRDKNHRAAASYLLVNAAFVGVTAALIAALT